MLGVALLSACADVESDILGIELARFGAGSELWSWTYLWRPRSPV